MSDILNTLINIFSYVCHQIPERSFLVFGGRGILCARCTGMYLGFFSGFILVGIFKNIREVIIIKMIACAVFILLLEIILESMHLFNLGNEVRFTTGILFGISVGVGIATPISNLIRENK
jgi:uncharacterized membrane protein